jgi:hypothetical protein
MITFFETEARNVEPGWMLLVDYGKTRIARKVRAVAPGRSGLRFKFADGDADLYYTNAARVWGATP